MTMTKVEKIKQSRGRSPPSSLPRRSPSTSPTPPLKTRSRPTTKTSHKLSLSSTIAILLKCIVFSLVTTLFLLYHVFDYKEEIHFITNEIWQQNQELIVSMTSFISSWCSPLTLFLIPTITTDTDTDTDTDRSAASTENQTLFEIYDMNHIPIHCKEINSLSHANVNPQQSSCRNLLSNEMKQSFQQNGVIAIRGLLSNDLFHQLNESSYNNLEQHLLEKGIGFKGGMNNGGINNNGKKNSKGLSGSSGKQFLMNPMGLVFTNDIHDNYYNNNDDDDDDDSDNANTNGDGNNNNHNKNHHQQELSPPSGFRNVALSSLIPQVVSELLNMKYYNDDSNDNNEENNHDENLRLLRYVVMEWTILSNLLYNNFCEIYLDSMYSPLKLYQ
jgi:hypothetical protein